MRNKIAFYLYPIVIFGILSLTFGMFSSCSRSKSDKELRASVVKLSGPSMMCSGEQIRARSGKEYILTASHCKPLEDKDGNIAVITEDGRRLERRVIAEDDVSDLLLLEGVPNLPALDIAKTMPTHVRTFTHGSNLATYETDGIIVEQEHETMVPTKVVEEDPITGALDASSCDVARAKYSVIEIPIFGPLTAKVCVMTAMDTVTTAMVVPGSSGGMVVDRFGDLVGVVSAGDGSFGFLVSLKDIQAFTNNY